MKRTNWTLSAMIVFSLCGAVAYPQTPTTSAQTPGAQTAQSQGDVCHVYVVDVEKARKAFEEYRNTGNPEADEKALAASQTLFPEFTTEIGEEVLTTKTYPFPDSNLVITASVYYTDESMASSQMVDSMLLGIAVSNSAHEDAISLEDNAVAEVTLNDRDTIRAKKFLKVNGRLYLTGIECHGEKTNDIK